MNHFDEYQKSLRYKYGYHSFIIVVALSIINFNLHLFYDFQWAETQGLEFVLIVFFSLWYSLVMNVYKGAYFHKNQKATRFALFFFIIGIANIYLSFSPHSPLMINGLITSNSIMLVSGLIWLSTPAAYFTRIMVDKKRDYEES